MNIYENKQKCEQSNDNQTQLFKFQSQLSSSNELKCPKAFDQILCWEETPANTWATQDCPEWFVFKLTYCIYDISYLHMTSLLRFIGFENRKGKAKRFCQADGTWRLKPNTNVTYTEYRACIDDLDAKLLAVKIYFFNKSHSHNCKSVLFELTKVQFAYFEINRQIR